VEVLDSLMGDLGNIRLKADVFLMANRFAKQGCMFGCLSIQKYNCNRSPKKLGIFSYSGVSQGSVLGPRSFCLVLFVPTVIQNNVLTHI
jgi:hypothetical protein